VVDVLRCAVREELPGVYNAAGDGVLVLSEVASLLGKPFAPVLPPWGTGLAAAALRLTGLRLSDEVLAQLRYGRGLDNRKLKAAGCRIAHTTRETVVDHAEKLRVRPLLDGGGQGYRYEREVEEFLRWSPHVRTREGDGETPRTTA
jgi:UDP-glucose 4-epimerase